MKADFYETIFKRKSFHLFRNVGDDKLVQGELDDIEKAYADFGCLYPDIKTAIRIVPASKVNFKRDAEFCILDEPFSNIAPNCVEKMQALIQEQKKSKGIIVSDHLYEAIIEVTDDLFLLRDGYTFPIKTREDLIRHGYILR